MDSKKKSNLCPITTESNAHKNATFRTKVMIIFRIDRYFFMIWMNLRGILTLQTFLKNESGIRSHHSIHTK